MIIDVGVGTYTRQTFSSERYHIWTMQSNYHNLPLINGTPQSFGPEYKATGTSFNKVNRTFSLDIAPAYPEQAGVKQWRRSYMLKKGVLKITDDFSLTKVTAPNQINFMTWGTIDTETPGVIKIEINGKNVHLLYDWHVFDVSKETLRLEDKRLSNVWGSEVCRLSLNAKKLTAKGKYKYEIKITQ